MIIFDEKPSSLALTLILETSVVEGALPFDAIEYAKRGLNEAYEKDIRK